MPPNLNLVKSKSSLILLILTLTPKEWEGFKDFVDSPFFNKDKKTKTLYQLLDKKFPFKRGIYKMDLLPALGQKKEYPSDYQLEKKEDGALRKLMMRFANLLKEYIIYNATKDQETYRQRKLVDYLMSRRQYDLIPGILKKQSRLVEEDAQLNQQYHLNKFLLAEAEFYMLIIMNDQKDTAITQQLINSLLDYSLSMLMTYYSAAFNRETILNLSHAYPLLEPVMDYIHNNQKTISPLARVYFHIFNLIEKKNPASLVQIKQIMEDFPEFDITTQRQLYSHLLNFCSKKIRLGTFSYRQEKHKIYQEALSKKIFTSGLYFSAQHFLLIAKNALKLGCFEWAETFVNNYKYDLNPKFESQVFLAKAYTYFYTKNYEEALACLIKINYSKDFFSILQYRVLWIQIHYENETIDDSLATNALEALRQYLSNEQKMSTRIKSSHLNFMKLTKRLLRLRTQVKYHKKESLIIKLKTDIQETIFLDERDWLLNKIDSLIASM